MSYAGLKAKLSNRQSDCSGARLNINGREKIRHTPNHICISANGSSAFVQTAILAEMCEHAHMDAHREAIRAYLVRVVEVSGLDLTNIARRAKMAPSTLTRFANKPEGKYILSLRTLSKVSTVTGVPVPAEVAEGPAGHATILEDADKLGQLEHQQLSLLNRSWDSLYDDERAAIVATARAFIANRPKTA